MDLCTIKDMLYTCTEANAKNSKPILEKKCKNCPYYKTTDCRSRLMLDAAHAIYLIMKREQNGDKRDYT